MSEVQKKKINFKEKLFGKKINIPENVAEPDLNSPTTPTLSNNPKSSAPVMLRAKQSNARDRPNTYMKSMRGSMGAIEDLVQCPLCMEKLSNPKMMACQHTFCFHCLETQIVNNVLKCPSCQTQYQVTSPKFLHSLPSNLYIDNLLKLLMIPNQPMDNRPMSLSPPAPAMNVGQKRCVKCQSIMEASDEHNCNHCKQIFCGVCWSAHISDLKSQISSLMKQLEMGSTRLNHRLADYRDRHESLVNKINDTAAKKIEELTLEKERLLAEVNKILLNGESAASTLEQQLKTTKDNVRNCISNNFDAVTNDEDKVVMFMNYHRMTIQVLNEVSHFGDSKYVFDQDNFKIEDDTTQEDAEADEPVTVEVKGIQNPLENSEVLNIYYRSRNFTPRMSWKKCQRPAGVSVAPWDNHENIYICTMDSQHILVIDKHKGKVLQRITDPNMLCPHSIAFSQTRKEIYVTDKWNHCVHVISKDGTFLRKIGAKGDKGGFFRSPEGIAVDQTENFLFVCDTGNDVVQVFSLDTGAFIRFIGIINSKTMSNVKITQLNAPTGIAVTNEKVIVVDSGNRKIKTFSINGEKLHEFGSFGSHKGQFRHPEAIAVDPLGFILVGDSGNARVQIFKPNGALVRVFGGRGQNAGQYGWISGLHITPQLEIIISDPRKHQVCII